MKRTACCEGETAQTGGELFFMRVCLALWRRVCVLGSLTVDDEGDSSTQISIQVIEICGRALVHTGIWTLDGLQDQHTTHTADGFILREEACACCGFFNT